MIDHLRAMSKDMSPVNADETLGVFETALKTTTDAFQPSAMIEEKAELVLENVFGLARSLTSSAPENEIEAAREAVATALSSFQDVLSQATPKAADPEFSVAGATGPSCQTTGRLRSDLRYGPVTMKSSLFATVGWQKAETSAMEKMSAKSIATAPVKVTKGTKRARR